MQTQIFWKRPDLVFPSPFDAIFFDVDGVLIRAIESFRAADIAVAEYVAGVIHGLDWGQREGKRLLTLDDVKAFKQAGGYNNDWDMSYLLATLATARLREWKGTPLAERSSEEWAALSRAANLRGHGGVEWVREAMPPSAQPNYDVVGDLYHEFYWGAEEYRKRYGRELRYLADFPGFVRNEKMLFPPDLPMKLRKAGIHHLGLITGRVGPEVDSVLERMEAYSGERWWDVVIPADAYAKPDPRALSAAIETVGARGGLYIGDTGDDLDVVLRYEAERKPDDPAMLAVMVVSKDEVELYQKRGADFVVSSVRDVVRCLPDYIKVE